MATNFLSNLFGTEAHSLNENFSHGTELKIRSDMRFAIVSGTKWCIENDEKWMIVDEKMSEWVSDGVNEWINEWLNENRADWKELNQIRLVCVCVLFIVQKRFETNELRLKDFKKEWKRAQKSVWKGRI